MGAAARDNAVESSAALLRRVPRLFKIDFFESSVFGPSALRFFRLLLGDLIHQATRATRTSPDRIRIAFPANMSPENKWLSL
jgi:hypothetical protein